MAKFIGGYLGLFNPAHLVRLFPGRDGDHEDKTLAELVDGRIVDVRQTWDSTFDENYRDNLAAIPNVDSSMHAVIVFPEEDGDGTGEVIKVYPILAWRDADQYSDFAGLIPITISGEFDPSDESFEVGIFTSFGYWYPARGKYFNTKGDFVAAARRQVSERQARRAEIAATLAAKATATEAASPREDAEAQ